MTLEKLLLQSGLIKDDTEIYIRDTGFHVLAYGNWYQDNVLEYMYHDLESFTWQDDDKIYLDLKEK